MTDTELEVLFDAVRELWARDAKRLDGPPRGVYSRKLAGLTFGEAQIAAEVLYAENADRMPSAGRWARAGYEVRSNAQRQAAQTRPPDQWPPTDDERRLAAAALGISKVLATGLGIDDRKGRAEIGASVADILDYLGGRIEGAALRDEIRQQAQAWRPRLEPQPAAVPTESREPGDEPAPVQDGPRRPLTEKEEADEIPF